MPNDIEDLLSPLASLQHLLSRYNDQGVIIGGIAASLLGKPRLTVDIDAMFLLSILDIPSFLRTARIEGFEPRIEGAGDFARKNRVLLLRHTSSDTNIDISLGILPFEEEMVKRSVVYKLGTLSLRLPTPEDLIIIKAVAHRPKDLLDIQAVVEKHPDLDIGHIEQWVKAFADVLDFPQLWQDVHPLLNVPPKESES